MEIDREAKELQKRRDELVVKMLDKQIAGNPVKEYVIPIGSLIVALVGVLSGVYVQEVSGRVSLQTATIEAKQTGYATLLTALDEAFYAKQEERLNPGALDRIRSSYYQIELLLKESSREPILTSVEELIAFISQSNLFNAEYIKSYTELRRKLRTSLQIAMENA